MELLTHLAKSEETKDLDRRFDGWENRKVTDGIGFKTNIIIKL